MKHIMELKQPAIKARLNSISANVLLRPITINDEIELQQELGKHYLAAIADGKMKNILTIFYHQLVDKTLFNTTELQFNFSDGEKLTKRVSGLNMLCEIVAVNSDEQDEIIRSVTELIALSNPDIAHDVKKKTIRNLAKWKMRRLIFSTFAVFFFGIIIGASMMSLT